MLAIMFKNNPINDNLIICLFWII